MLDIRSLEMFIRIITAVVLGGVIGFERAGRNHDAGLRTHILVCLGATTVMILSEQVVTDLNVEGEILRMGAQVISGIGFLGMGSIIVNGNKIKGLTTAAGLWTTACLGLVIGLGYYLLAVTVAAVMLFVIMGLHPVARWLQDKSTECRIYVGLERKKDINCLMEYLIEEGVFVTSVKIDDNSENDNVNVILDLKIQKSTNKSALLGKIMVFDGVRDATLL